ncbi:MAG TPA: ABC transporter permease [Ignavibacteriaceae bacterium]|nr:ABC transporter permease [Ignavibacteriaceae bacterium]
MFKRTLAIAKKEVRQLKRDSRMLFVLFAFPVLLLVIFGYAINFDVHHIKMAVYDQDRSVDSRNFIDMLTSSDYFDIIGYINDESQIKKILDVGDAQCVLVFPKDMSKDFYSGREAKIQILVDGVNGNTATIVSNYITAATSTYSQKISQEVLDLKGRKSYNPIDLQPVFWFNPALLSTLFLIPGLIAMILIITAVIAISLSIVREKERGTIEQIHVSPLSAIELLLGKTIPYVIIGLFIAAMILVAGNILFGVVVNGSYILLFLTTLLFLFASSNLGIFVSSIADTQQVAFQIATLVSLLPSVILSGFIFPIDSMPAVIQVITNITPAKFYIIILRSILLKGVGLSAFWPEVIYLFIFAFFFLGLATLINKKSESA